jgi:hypothetical protein
MNPRTLCTLLLAVCLSATVCAEPGTGNPGGTKPKTSRPSATHPYYRTALSNLRTARWMIFHHPRNWQPTADESAAVGHIDAAIAAIKRASIYDGKTLADRPKAAQRKNQPRRLNIALNCLKKARVNISRDGDKDLGEGLQRRTYEQIDIAIKAVKKTLGVLPPPESIDPGA